MGDSPDELYSLRNYYWLGHYQSAINEVNNALTRVKDPTLVNEKEEYVYRSYIALGQYNLVLSEIKDSPSLSVGKFGVSSGTFSLSIFIHSYTHTHAYSYSNIKC